MTARAQTPNAPTWQHPTTYKSSAIQIAARCRQQRQLPSRRRHRSSATSPIHVGYAPQPTHTPPTDPREPSSPYQPAPQMLLRALPAPPTQLRLLHGSLIFDFEICPIKSLNPSTSHKKDDCSPSLLPCTSSLRSATTFRLYASPPLHLKSSSHLFSSYYSLPIVISTTRLTLLRPARRPFVSHLFGLLLKLTPSAHV